MNHAIAQLADAGFDLVHTFDPIAAAREPGWDHLAGGHRLALLIGNTRALWPHFVAAMKDPALAAEPDPLDRYTERAVDAAFPGARVEYAHRAYDGRYRPFQRLAAATGFGVLVPSQLVIHPIYGPWFALRAVILVDGAAPVHLPIAPPYRCTQSCGAAFEAARDATHWESWLAVRDACSQRAWRYPEDQIRYHYTKEWIPPVEDADPP